MPETRTPIETAGKSLAELAAAIEGRGLQPRLVEGSPLNIQVTRPADLVLARAAMRALRVAR